MTITTQIRTEAANVSSKLRGSSDRSERDMGDLLWLALQVEGFDHSYSADAIVKAQSAIIYAELGAEKLMARALEELSVLRGYGRLYAT